MIRVLLVDDEAMVRAGVRAILANEPEIEVVAEASGGREGVRLAGSHRPDVALVDIRMPGMNGLDAAAEMRRSAPGTAVVILTTFGEEEYVVRALDGGADGFLLKTGDPRELLLGVRAVAEGGAFLSPRVARRVLNSLDHARSTGRLDARERLAGLTDREREVLALLGSGLSNQEIGARLFLVEGTVKGHVSTILKRLGVRNRVEAAVLAYEAGLVGEGRGRDA
ncbi:DNA-binding response regulator [Nocardiopsis terrae]|uniref:DNA-binding NarL/FixJ family response regulator n=1 Tax=Nocardiopsis terrae TaxID=372655 RepID=A0ABR9HKI6_9ACTN|nr:response regulator transcription factor [Nocardiopsis terrae]MBE1459514.1 DNA-binding NarL/FixJ family response regulator [Nocardiopsis terrae]GHC95255.1 DNA-binding response regulator [Nocardiopsis terrae]